MPHQNVKRRLDKRVQRLVEEVKGGAVVSRIEEKMEKKRMFLFVVTSMLVAALAIAIFSANSGTNLSKHKALVAESEVRDLAQHITEIMDAEFDQNAAIRRLGRLLSFPTVSSREMPDHLEDRTSVENLIHFMRGSEGFPLSNQHLSWELVGRNLSVLITWEGKNPALDPILLISHLDVVPVANSEISLWHYHPFSGILDASTGFLYGRGALDTKATAAGPLEAVETLLRFYGPDFRPERTIIFAFGHDEEVGGRQGAGQLSLLLKSRNINPEYCLDEGGSVTQRVLPGISKPVALIGVSEKGWSVLNITITSHGGHSSIPSRFGTVIDHAARVILAIRKARLPRSIHAPVSHLIEYLAPHLPHPLRFIASHVNLFSGLLRIAAERSDELIAQMGPTFAATMIHGGIAQNVIPETVSLLQSWRTSSNMKNATEFVAKVIERTPSLRNSLFHIGVRECSEGSEPPSPISKIDEYFRKIQRYIAVAYGTDTLSAPFEWLGGTDSKWYISRGVGKRHYRFGPIFLDGNSDFRRIHSTNERIHTDTYKKMVHFYMALMLDTTEFKATGHTNKNKLARTA
jgi:carboxypeptidase PM20D1